MDSIDSTGQLSSIISDYQIKLLMHHISDPDNISEDSFRDLSYFLYVYFLESLINLVSYHDPESVPIVKDLLLQRYHVNVFVGTVNGNTTISAVNDLATNALEYGTDSFDTWKLLRHITEVNVNRIH